MKIITWNVNGLRALLKKDALQAVLSRDPDVLCLRSRQQRNFLATLFLSQGVPMLLGGDEIGRTQQGNNNAYCQDNELSWYDWQKTDEDLLSFCRRLVHYRRDHPVFRRRRWFQGRPILGSQNKDIAWFTLKGKQMTEEDWNQGLAKVVGVFLNGKTIPNPNPKGEPVVDDNFYLIFNADHKKLYIRLPSSDWGRIWAKELDTVTGWAEKERRFEAGTRVMIQARSLVLLRHES